MKRSRSIRLVIMGATSVGAPLILGGCGNDPQDFETMPFASIEDCLGSGLSLDACSNSQFEARKAHEEVAERFIEKGKCEEEYGKDRCEVRQAPDGTSFFIPLMAGYAVARLLNNNAPGYNGNVYAPAQPLYSRWRDRPREEEQQGGGGFVSSYVYSGGGGYTTGSSGGSNFSPERTPSSATSGPTASMGTAPVRSATAPGGIPTASGPNTVTQSGGYGKPVLSTAAGTPVGVPGTRARIAGFDLGKPAAVRPGVTLATPASRSPSVASRGGFGSVGRAVSASS